MGGDYMATVRSHVEEQLEPGEELEGVVSVVEHRMFRGLRYFALGVTGDRLILQQTGRKGEAKGESRSLARADVASAELKGGGDYRTWSSRERIGAAIANALSLSLELRTTGGEKLKLTMQRGDVIARFGGGEEQQEGTVALVGWLQRHAAG